MRFTNRAPGVRISFLPVHLAKNCIFLQFLLIDRRAIILLLNHHSCPPGPIILFIGPTGRIIVFIGPTGRIKTIISPIQDFFVKLHVCSLSVKVVRILLVTNPSGKNKIIAPQELNSCPRGFAAWARMISCGAIILFLPSGLVTNSIFKNHQSGLSGDFSQKV